MAPPKKLKEEQAKAVEEAQAAADESGTGNPVLAPETSNVPEPGTTSSDPNEVDVVNTDDAKSLNPNVTVSGTKPDGQGGQVLLDTVDPSVANAALIPDTLRLSRSRRPRCRNRRVRSRPRARSCSRSRPTTSRGTRAARSPRATR